MTTSQTYAFQRSSLNTFILEAYERLGMLGDNLTAQQMQAANRSLNFLLTSWMNDGIPLWQVKEKILPLVVGENTYDLEGITVDVLEMNYRQKGRQDTLMTALSRSEWMALPNKKQPGIPTCFYFDKTIKPRLCLWPCPNEAHSSLFFTATQMMEDGGDLLNEVQVPGYFYEPLVAGLAVKLAVKYVPQKASLLQDLYEKSYSQAQAQNVEKQPLRIGVSWQGGYPW